MRAIEKDNYFDVIVMNSHLPRRAILSIPFRAQRRVLFPLPCIIICLEFRFSIESYVSHDGQHRQEDVSNISVILGHVRYF